MTKMGWRKLLIFYTILSILEMILLEVLGSEGEDDLNNGGSTLIVVVVGGSSTVIGSSNSSSYIS
jgi:hypothetical protein